MPRETACLALDQSLPCPSGARRDMTVPASAHHPSSQLSEVSVSGCPEAEAGLGAKVQEGANPSALHFSGECRNPVSRQSRSHLQTPSGDRTRLRTNSEKPPVAVNRIHNSSQSQKPRRTSRTSRSVEFPESQDRCAVVIAWSFVRIRATAGKIEPA